MSEWCYGVNLAHVAKVIVLKEGATPTTRDDTAIYVLVGIDGNPIGQVELDDDEYAYFFPRALIAAPLGTEVVRLKWDIDETLDRHFETVVGVLLDTEFTEGGRPVCADGLAWFRSNEHEMVLWRFPGGQWHEPCSSEVYYSLDEAEAAYRNRCRIAPVP